MKTDLNFNLSSYMRNRRHTAYKAQNVEKTNETFDLLGCSQYSSKTGSFINYMVI